MPLNPKKSVELCLLVERNNSKEWRRVRCRAHLIAKYRRKLASGGVVLGYSVEPIESLEACRQYTLPDFSQCDKSMGNAEKRRKRAKRKAKESRANKHSTPSPFPYSDVTYGNDGYADNVIFEQEMDITDEVEAFFKTLPPFTLEFEALPSIKRFIEAQGDTPSHDMMIHTQELTALFAHWSDGAPLYTSSIMDMAENMGTHPAFLAAYCRDEPALSSN